MAFVLKDSTKKNEKIVGDIKETLEYIKENGIEAGSCFISEEDDSFVLPGDKKEMLVICDSGRLAERLFDQGYYVIGLWHELNTGEHFRNLKYIFSNLTDIDFDSFVKTYQRYAGEPWEVIRTDRLIIRETTLEDIDEFYKIYADPDMTRYMEGLFDDPADEKRYQKDYIEKVYGLMGFGVWTLVRRSDGRIIGRAGYSVRNGFEDVELGFLIGKEFQRQGYAYEACSEILKFGQEILLFDKVQTLVKKENEVSLHLCEKLGFIPVEETEVEENIYGHSYDGTKVALSQCKYGTYIKMVKHFL